MSLIAQSQQEINRLVTSWIDIPSVPVSSSSKSDYSVKLLTSVSSRPT